MFRTLIISTCLYILLLPIRPLHIVAQNEVHLAFTGEVGGLPAGEVHETAELRSASLAIGVLGAAAAANADFAKGAAQMGFGAMSMAGSGVTNLGLERIHTLLEEMRHEGIECAGVKAMADYATLDRNGRRIGLVAFGTALHTIDMTDSLMPSNMVAALAEKCDIVIVAFSTEGRGTHTAYAPAQHLPSVAFAHKCIDAGADIVVGDGLMSAGAASSSIGPLELYHDRLIIYGLGQFCTPMGRGQTGAAGVAPLIETTLYADGTFKSGRIVSFRQRGREGPLPDTRSEALRIIKNMTQRDMPDTPLGIDADGTITPTTEPAYALAMKMLTEAERHKGKRYQMGANGPNAFDCSGFTSYVFAKFGIKLERMAAAQYTQGHAVDRKNLRPGDLVFFTRSSVRGVGHVGIVYSVDKQHDSFKFIHASVSKGITIDDFSTSAYYIKRYVGARRILED